MVTRGMADSVRVFATAVPIALIIGPLLPARAVMPVAVLVLGTLTILYTIRGGMRAVVWTEIVQASVYLIGGISAMLIAVSLVPGGWGAIIPAASAAGKLQIVSWYTGFDQPNTMFAGIIGGAFLSMASHGADQLIVQRLLSARSLQGVAGRGDRQRRRGHLSVRAFSDARRVPVGVLRRTGVPDSRLDFPDVHRRPHAARIDRPAPRRRARGDDEHALRRDQLARRRVDA